MLANERDHLHTVAVSLLSIEVVIKYEEVIHQDKFQSCYYEFIFDEVWEFIGVILCPESDCLCSKTEGDIGIEDDCMKAYYYGVFIYYFMV